MENRSEGLSAIASFSDITSVSMEIPASQPLFSSPDLTSRSEGSVNALRMRPAVYASAVAAAPAAELAPEAGANASTSAAADDNPAVRELPAFTPTCFSNSQWGNLTSDEFSHAIMAAYSEAVHWKRNIFLVPSGSVGKEFIQEMARIFEAYAEGSQLESFALTAAMTMPLLLLQKPHKESKTSDHVTCLRCRLAAWKSGNVDGLVLECRAIQEHLRKSNHAKVTAKKEEGALRGFTKLMLLGNIRGALRVLSQTPSGGVLSLSAHVEINGEQRRVFDILKDKYPQSPAPCTQMPWSMKPWPTARYSTLCCLNRSRVTPSAALHYVQKVQQDHLESTQPAGVECAQPFMPHQRPFATHSRRLRDVSALNMST